VTTFIFQNARNLLDSSEKACRWGSDGQLGREREESDEESGLDSEHVGRCTIDLVRLDGCAREGSERREASKGRTKKVVEEQRACQSKECGAKERLWSNGSSDERAAVV